MRLFEFIVVLLAGICLGIGFVTTPGTRNQRWLFLLIGLIVVLSWFIQQFIIRN